VKGICARTGKHVHSRPRAHAHLSALKTRTGYAGGVYRCGWCGGWHVGRRKGVKR
jgi:hypothetical protein